MAFLKGRMGAYAGSAFFVRFYDAKKNSYLLVAFLMDRIMNIIMMYIQGTQNGYQRKL